jgi:hypothetical protein
MTWWPGWDSVGGANAWAHFWFWFGIVCLFALGASEIVSHVYSLRKDELVATQSLATEAKREQDQKEAEARHTTEIGGLNEQLSEANSQVVKLQKQAAPRRVLAADNPLLIPALANFPGQKVEIVAIMNDPESERLAQDFISIFDAAGWDRGGTGDAGVIRATFIPPAEAVIVMINRDEALADRWPPAARTLAVIIKRLGLSDTEAMHRANEVTIGVVRLVVGTKPHQ